MYEIRSTFKIFCWLNCLQKEHHRSKPWVWKSCSSQNHLRRFYSGGDVLRGAACSTFRTHPSLEGSGIIPCSCRAQSQFLVPTSVTKDVKSIIDSRENSPFRYSAMWKIKILLIFRLNASAHSTRLCPVKFYVWLFRCFATKTWRKTNSFHSFAKSVVDEEGEVFWWLWIQIYEVLEVRAHHLLEHAIVSERLVQEVIEAIF